MLVSRIDDSIGNKNNNTDLKMQVRKGENRGSDTALV